MDSNPPVIRASATEGFVDENSPIGTKVVDSSGKPIYITVTDADLVSTNTVYLRTIIVIINRYVRFA